MPNKNVLEKIQSHFPRQKTLNAIDVFMSIEKPKELGLSFGRNVEEDLKLLSANNKQLEGDYYFNGSELSLRAVNIFNYDYGLVALINILSTNAKFEITKEFVRALIKRSVFLLAKKNESLVPNEKKLTSKNLLAYEKKDFYYKLLDISEIIQHMRDSRLKKFKRHLKKPSARAISKFETSIENQVKTNLFKEHGDSILEFFDQYNSFDAKMRKSFLGFIMIADKRLYRSLCNLNHN